MQSSRHAAVLSALLVLVAGCAAGLPGGTAGSETAAGTASAGPTGTVALYLSDQPNAIGDFRHLNVTVTQVGFHPKGADGEDADQSPTALPSPNGTTPNVTATANATVTASPATDTDGDDAQFGDWVVESVDNETVDLTELVGDNASRIADVELPAGEYNGVFVRVTEVNGTLEDGTHVEVKLPSQRLKLNAHVTVGENASVGFVFDIAVHETGNGRYILRPVISESGADVPINPVGGDGAGDAPPEAQAGDEAPAAADNRTEGGGPPDDQGQGQDN